MRFDLEIAAAGSVTAESFVRYTSSYAPAAFIDSVRFAYQLASDYRERLL